MNTFRIIGLTAVALAVISIALVSMVLLAKPPSLTTQFFTQQVTLLSWQNTISIPVSDLPCRTVNGYSTPQTTIALGWNFTEDQSVFTGRDPGSTWVQLRGQANTTLLLFRQQDVTSPLIGEIFCTSPGLFNSYVFSKAQAVLSPQNYPLTTAYRAPASGTFVLMTISYSNTVLPSIGSYLANETWTVTTIT